MSIAFSWHRLWVQISSTFFNWSFLCQLFLDGQLVYCLLALFCLSVIFSFLLECQCVHRSVFTWIKRFSCHVYAYVKKWEKLLFKIIYCFLGEESEQAEVCKASRSKQGSKEDHKSSTKLKYGKILCSNLLTKYSKTNK